jgi:hypothetical protein
MKPWEKRLDDLAFVLQNTARTYFEPNLFRRNVNHFLQTARTVTFIVQKNKSQINNYEELYPSLAEEWSSDGIMKWAKDSRNQIEKQGDLELHSTLKATLIYSYLAEDDLEIEVGDEELLNAHLSALTKLAKSRFPKALWSNAAVRIERMWISDKLPEKELLSALQYTYSQLYRLCIRIARADERRLPNSIPEPSAIQVDADISRHVEYVRVRDGEVRGVSHEIVKYDKNLQLPESFANIAPKLKLANGQRHDFRTAIDFHALMASTTFEHFDNHMPMVFLYDEDWNIVGNTTPVLEDQTDKYFFWRSLGDQIETQSIYAFASIAEAWIRDFSHDKYKPIGELPIIGERLQLIIASRADEFYQCTWTIERDKQQQPMLISPEITENDEEAGFIYIPPMRALGIEPKCAARARGKRD